MKKLRDIVETKGWKKQYSGYYKHHTGWTMEKQNPTNWVVTTPRGTVFDSASSKKELMKTYGHHADLTKDD